MNADERGLERLNATAINSTKAAKAQRTANSKCLGTADERGLERLNATAVGLAAPCWPASMRVRAAVGLSALNLDNFAVLGVDEIPGKPGQRHLRAARQAIHGIGPNRKGQCNA